MADFKAIQPYSTLFNPKYFLDSPSTGPEPTLLVAGHYTLDAFALRS